MKTFSAKAAEVTHEWFVIDATDKVLGRVASEVALRLRGKHKAIYTPHVDTGDFIVVVNAEKIRVTGNKANDKVYYRHSGYPGGISATNFRDMQAKHPGRALEKAVKSKRPVVIDVYMENVPTPTAGHWNIMDIYSPGKKVHHASTEAVSAK